MRKVVGLMAILCPIALAQAQDSNPTAPAASAVPASSAVPTASAPPAASAKPASAEFTPEEKNLLRHGYKLEVRGGERRFCREEDTLGSRLHAHKVCGSVESLTRRAEINKEAVRDNLQTTVINKDPTGH